MGDPCIVSGSMDCCKAFPWTATTIDRMGSQGLFHSINWDSCVLLRKVSSQFKCGYLSHSSSALALSLFPAFSSPPSLQKSRYANLWLTSASDQSLSCHTRTQLLRKLSFFLTSFQLPKSCRCLYWDHTLSLEFESIMQSLWLTPMKQLAWLQLFSKIAYTLKPAVVSSARNSVYTPSHRVLYWRYYCMICLGCGYIYSFTKLCLSIYMTTNENMPYSSRTLLLIQWDQDGS
jgi:hypothetical protein